MEFKGTKGKWCIHYNGFYNEISSTSNSYDGKVFKAYTLLHDCKIGVVDISNSDEDKANALLISKAPEMLEMLQLWCMDMEERGHAYGDCYTMTKALINSATQIK